MMLESLALYSCLYVHQHERESPGALRRLSLPIPGCDELSQQGVVTSHLLTRLHRVPVGPSQLVWIKVASRQNERGIQILRVSEPSTITLVSGQK